MAPKNIVIAFDAYGTLLSTESIAKRLGSHFGDEKAKAVAATWRKYQLEYTWRLNSMNRYEDFSHITLRSLRHALAESGISPSEVETDDLMKAYDSLSTFPDVGPALQGLRTMPDVTVVVFSNGTHKMVSNSVKHSPDLSPHADVFKDIVVVEEIKKFKPAPEVYKHLVKTVGKNWDSKEERNEMWLVSGNPFDVVGARAVGMNAIWVDRAGNGWQDELVHGATGRPTKTVKSLEDVVPAIMNHESDG